MQVDLLSNLIAIIGVVKMGEEFFSCVEEVSEMQSKINQPTNNKKNT